MVCSSSSRCDFCGLNRRAMRGNFFSLRSPTCRCSWASSCSRKYENGNCVGGGADSGAKKRESLENHACSHTTHHRGLALLALAVPGEHSFEPAPAFVWKRAELRADEPGRTTVRLSTIIRQD